MEVSEALPQTEVSVKSRNVLQEALEEGRAITAKELAHILQVSEPTVFRQAKANRIPHFRIGTCVRFDPKKIQEWLKQKTLC